MQLFTLRVSPRLIVQRLSLSRRSLQALGADVLINYKEQCFRQVIEQETSTSKVATGVPGLGKTQSWGVDVILDLVGAVHFPKNIEVLVLEGRLLLVGAASGVETDVNLGSVRPSDNHCLAFIPGGTKVWGAGL